VGGRPWAGKGAGPMLFLSSQRVGRRLSASFGRPPGRPLPPPRGPALTAARTAQGNGPPFGPALDSSYAGLIAARYAHYKNDIERIMAESKNRMRARQRKRVEDRWPQLHPHQVPDWYRDMFASEDKVVLPGEGKNWIWKCLTAETTDLAYTFKSWRRLQEPYRNIRAFSFRGMLRSDINRRLLFPDLTVVLCVSSAFSFYNAYLAPTGTVIPGLHRTYEFVLHSNMLCLPMEPFVMVATAVGLLVTFRTQTSYARFVEARNIWAKTSANCRELYARILARIPTPRSKDPKIWEAREHGAKLVQSFPHALKYHVTPDGCNLDLDAASLETEEEIYKQKREHLREELQLIWDFNDKEERFIAEGILDDDITNWPLHICHELGRLNATRFASPNAGGLAPPNSEGIDTRIMVLQQIIADCEKLIQTPIYTPYTMFTNRVIFLFICALPPALYPLMGPVLGPITNVGIAWIFFGIDDIGRRVEMPFDNLPLWQFVDKIDQTCEQLRWNAEELERQSENQAILARSSYRMLNH